MIEIWEIGIESVQVNQVDVYNTWRSTGTSLLEYEGRGRTVSSC